MIKKLAALSLACVMLFQLGPVPAKAEEKDFFENSVILLVNSPMCFINGEMKSVGDVAPTILNDRTLVPVRFLTESLGGSVQWNEATQTATLNYGKDTIDVPIGQNKIVVNGEEQALDVGATVIADRTMLPVRAISEALGKSVGYDDGIISLSDKDVEQYDKNSPYSKLTMDAIRKKLSLERDGKKIVVPTSFTFEEMRANSGVLTFSEKDIPYLSKTDSYAVTGNIFIENLTIKEHSQTEVKMTFDAYNYDLVYGIVEVYDEDDQLISHKMIEPFGGMWTGITEYGVAAYNMGVSISDWITTGDVAYFTYRNKTQTKHTPIEVIVPKNGYVHVTANPGLSQILCAYDISKITTKTMTLALSTISALKNKDIMATFSAAIENDLIDTFTQVFTDNPNLYSEMILLLSEEADMKDSDKNTKNLAKKIIDLLTEKGVNVLDDAKATAVEILSKSTENIAAETASLFVDQGIGTALDSMSLINSASDYICLALDLQYSVSKRSLVFKLATDELEMYYGTANLVGKTISGTQNGIVYTNSAGEKRTLVSGNFEYVAYVTDGYDLYYYDKNSIAIYHINIKTGATKKVSDVYKYFDTYYDSTDLSRQDCLTWGGIAAYHDGKIYFEECGGFENYPMATIDIKTGEYQLTPLRLVGSMDFYKDKMFYMIQTGSFDLWPLHVADTNGNNSVIYKNDVWKFKVCDHFLYVCTGISKSYSDYDKGNLYRINLDTGAEELVAQNIKPSRDFDKLVSELHENVDV